MTIDMRLHCLSMNHNCVPIIHYHDLYNIAAELESTIASASTMTTSKYYMYIIMQDIGFGFVMNVNVHNWMLHC